MSEKFPETFGKYVYSILEDSKYVDNMVDFSVNNPNNSSWVITLTFATVFVSDKAIYEMVDKFQQHVSRYTGGRLGFMLAGYNKTGVAVSSSRVPPMEATMWEEYSQTKLSPQEGFNNRFVIKLRIRQL